MRKLALLSVVLFTLACKRSETPVNATRGAAPKPATTATAATTTGHQPSGTDIGAMMPEYSATMLDGSKFDVASMRGKVVLLNLWATWCGPCRTEIPELQMMRQKYAARGFEIVGVSVDESGPEAVKTFVDEQKVTYPIALDPDSKLASIFQTSVLPTSVLLDRNGRIVWKKYEQILPNDTALSAAIEKSL